VRLKRPFKSILIANRGEIAVRVARTCRAMGIRTIAIYSDADAGALHARTCDEAVGIGGIAPRDSYLDIDKVIDAARRSGAQALHPGYGFLSENAAFAQACADAHVVFVGPSPAAMRAMGDKIAAKNAVGKVGVPTVPGFSEREQDPTVLRAHAERIGTPLLIKAAAGGGGRGMRLVSDMERFEELLAGAQREARAAFGDGSVFLERYVERPRHIEVQIIADQHGSYFALGERECSIQRRYQKIVEESPSPAVDGALRERLQEAAIAAARSVAYTNAGTVEFMLDPEGRFYFLEMNARLQVEHPVTEAVTGVDLVREQIAVAAGERLALTPAFTTPRGHAIEVRVYAEDPAHDFLPSSGVLNAFEPPQGPGLRNDVAVETGSSVSSAYDPMLAKLIAYDRTRLQAIQRLQAALEEYVIGGVASNVPFLRWIVEQPAFVSGETTTDFLERHFDPARSLAPVDQSLAGLGAAGALHVLQTPQAGGPDALSSDPWARSQQWRHSAAPHEVLFAAMSAAITVAWDYGESAWRCCAGRRCALVEHLKGGLFTLRTENAAHRFAAWLTPEGVAVSWQGGVQRFALRQPPQAREHGAAHAAAGSGGGSVTAPMSGTIAKVLVQAGSAVEALQVIIVMEAMKMEHSIVAPYSGTVRVLPVSEGSSVAAGDVVAEIAES